MSDVDNWVAKYLEYVDRGVAMIPYKRAAIWKEFFFNPTATIKTDNVTVMQRLKDLYVITVISVVFAALIMVPAALIGTVTSGGPGLFAYGIIGAAMLVLFALEPLLGFVYSLLELAVAKALGGTGDMKANFSASALPGLGVFVINLPIAILSIPLGWFSMIPIIGLCASCIRFPISLVSMGLGLYSIYLKYLAMKEVHKLSSFRAAAVVVVPIFLLIAIFVALVVLLYAMMFAFFMNMMAAADAGAGGAY